MLAHRQLNAMNKFTEHHRVEFDSIRSIAIECHALDLSAHKLFIDGNHQASRSTKRIYEELRTSKLLMLAILIRTKFYQGAANSNTSMFIEGSCFYHGDEKIKNADKITLKDICDKIIHTENIRSDLIDNSNGLLTVIKGENNKRKWEIHMSVSEFSEGVLNWIDSVD